MKRHLTLVSPAKTLKRATSKSTPFISGGYDYDARHWTFARQHDPALGEIVPLKPLMPWMTIILRGVLGAIAFIGLLWLVACGPAPISKEVAAAHSEAYKACASVAKTDVELQNCAYAVERMH